MAFLRKICILGIRIMKKKGIIKIIIDLLGGEKYRIWGSM